MAVLTHTDMSIEKALSTVYTEHPSELHTLITESMIEGLVGKIGRGIQTILDVGCGMGVAWPSFNKAWPGCEITVVTPDQAETWNAMESGLYWAGRTMHEVRDHAETGYDLVWARHSLEHSVSPYLDLAQIKNVLSEGGWFYMEVPAPGTVCKHECNPNHYSVLGRLMWLSLLDKTGFLLIDSGELGIALEIGPDSYYWFLCEHKH